MVQQFQVLRCCDCQTFQVHQCKKAKKWACKLCGVKQSYIKVYGEGSGADCRQHVQKLNMMRGEIDNRISSPASNAESPLRTHPSYSQQERIENLSAASGSGTRWQQYLGDTIQDGATEDVDDGDDLQFTTDRGHFDASRKPKRYQNRHQQNDFYDTGMRKRQRTDYGHYSSATQNTRLTEPWRDRSSQASSSQLSQPPENFTTLSGPERENEIPHHSNISGLNLIASTAVQGDGDDRRTIGYGSGLSVGTQRTGVDLFTSAKHVIPMQFPASERCSSRERTQEAEIKTDLSKQVNNCTYRPARSQVKKQQASSLSKWAQFVEAEKSDDDDDDDSEENDFESMNDHSLRLHNSDIMGDYKDSTPPHEQIREEFPDTDYVSDDKRSFCDWTVKSHGENGSSDRTVTSHGSDVDSDWSQVKKLKADWTSHSENIPPVVQSNLNRNYSSAVHGMQRCEPDGTHSTAGGFFGPKKVPSKSDQNEDRDSVPAFAVEDDLDALLDDF